MLHSRYRFRFLIIFYMGKGIILDSFSDIFYLIYDCQMRKSAKKTTFTLLMIFIRVIPCQNAQFWSGRPLRFCSKFFYEFFMQKKEIQACIVGVKNQNWRFYHHFKILAQIFKQLQFFVFPLQILKKVVFSYEGSITRK